MSALYLTPEEISWDLEAMFKSLKASWLGANCFAHTLLWLNQPSRKLSAYYNTKIGKDLIVKTDAAAKLRFPGERNYRTK